MTALPPAVPARKPAPPHAAPPRPVPSLPPGFLQEGAAVRAEEAGPGAGTVGAAPGAWLPANDGTGPYAGGPLAALPSWRPEPRDPWAIAWTAVASVATTSMVGIGALFGYISPIWCGSCDKAEQHRFDHYYWGYWVALLIPLILLIGGSSLPPHKRYATVRIVFLASAMALSVLIPVLYYELLGTVH
ncbi:MULTISPECIES: hypothetical protein [Streptomyces]|uniref:Integral membrane protein n=1 Tax=Streptomyces ramulosus TaxID=47762 RepID=A0ABW1FNF1_9ACTN